MQMKRLILPVVLVTVLAGCGSRSSTVNYAAASDEKIATDSYSSDVLSSDADNVVLEDPSNAITGDKLVYTGALTVETLTYEDTVKAVTTHIQKYKGIVEHQEAYDGDTGWYEADGVRTAMRTMELTVRIPTESYDSFMNDIEGDGRVTQTSSSVENITKKYNDNSAEITALEKQQSRLLEMMDQANTVEDMIAVEQRLSEVETELNQKKTDQASMDTDIQYSTVYVTISEVQRYQSTAGKDISDFGGRMKDAFESVGVTFIWLLQGIALAVVYILPYAAVIGLIVLIVKLIEKVTGKKLKLLHKKQKD